MASELLKDLGFVLLIRWAIENGPVILHEAGQCLLELRINEDVLKFHDDEIEGSVVGCLADA